VGKLSAIGQPTRPTQPFVLSGSIVVVVVVVVAVAVAVVVGLVVACWIISHLYSNSSVSVSPHSVMYHVVSSYTDACRCRLFIFSSVFNCCGVSIRSLILLLQPLSSSAVPA